MPVKNVTLFMVILWLLVQQFLISASHMTKTTLITLPLVFHFISTQIYAIWGITKIHTLYVNQWIKDRLGSCPRLMGWLKTSLIIVDSSSLSLTGCSTVPSVIEYLKTTIFHSFLFLFLFIHSLSKYLLILTLCQALFWVLSIHQARQLCSCEGRQKISDSTKIKQK